MNGIIPIWKERGMTSHDIVFKARKILGTKKIGHSGTLDPNVDGVLPIGIGKGTKVIEYMMDSNKIYTGEISIGFATTTEDLDGEIVESTRMEGHEVDERLIDATLKQFEGEITQIPPMYSAVKVNGRRLYDYARNNETVERPKRQVMIYSFERTGEVIYHTEDGVISFPFKVECSKGTYIRTLATDVGKALGLPACMSQLTRIKSANYTSSDAITLEELKEIVQADNASSVLQPIESALSHLCRVDLSDDEWAQVKNGALLKASDYSNQYPLAMFYQDLVVAIYEPHPSKNNKLKPKKVFRTEL